MTKRNLTIQDLHRFEIASNPVLSPNGDKVIYEKRITDEKENGYNTQLVMADTAGGSIRPLTHSGTKNHSALWSPDGKFVAFVSDRSFGSQLWILPMEGGEARQVTRLRYGISRPRWSPDGRTVYALTSVTEDGAVETFAQDMTSKDAKEEMERLDKEWAEGPKRVTRLSYRHDGGGMWRGRYEQLIAINVETGEVRQLTHGNYDVHSFDLSPDGAYIAFISNRSENPDSHWWIADVYRISTTLADGVKMELLAQGVSAGLVSYSPDGKRIAMLAEGEAQEKYKSAAHLHLFTISSAGGELRHLSKDFPDTLDDTNLTDVGGDGRAVPPAWSKDGRYLYVLSTREGRCEIVRFETESGSNEAGVVAGGDRDIYGFAFDGVDKFVLSYATATVPSVLATITITGIEPRLREFRSVTAPMVEAPVPIFPADEVRLDDCNLKWLSEVNVVEPEAFYYTSQDGWRAQGWVMRPANFEEGKKYPVILEIHGGPQLNYGYSMFHEMQWLAAQGYAIVYTNPRGGMSYGQEFVNAIRGHYGEGDAADVLNGLDAALGHFEFLDGERVAVTGGSYGGFMTNWLVGHTDQFFAAVSQRSISNWISFYGVSDIGPLFVEDQHGLNPMQDMEALWKISPLAYAENVKTPLLLIHSENDLRCPIEQAEQFYTCIKRLGGEVELFRVPNASHGLSRNGKPKLRVDRLNAILDFISGHLAQ